MKLFGEGAIDFNNEVVVGDHIYLQGLCIFYSKPTTDLFVGIGAFTAWSGSNLGSSAENQEYAVSYTAARSDPPCVAHKVTIMLFLYINV